ncbi:MAG TPA: CHAT domain-containing tetratricopeptide repeat protein [Terriglobales bacterium]|nr:CHAT domain-containing tetratricopeptide repeat protein [Terriglobales bacterium]
MTRLLLVAALLLLAPITTHAQLQGVGSEAAIGSNGTGEACRVRVTQDDAARGLTRLVVLCEGWRAPSGALLHFKVARDTTPARLLTDSAFQKSYETRLTECKAVEATSLGDGTPAALRQCLRADGGWPMVVIAAAAGGRGYALETFPTNVRVLEAAIGVLQGKPLAGAGREGTQSAAIRRAETIVGAGGKLIGVQDVGAVDALWRLAKLQFRSGSYVSCEATLTRLLEIHERAVGADKPGAGAILNELALTMGRQHRYADADKVFARAESVVQKTYISDEALLLLAYRASVHRDDRPAEGLVWAEKAMDIAKNYPETGNGRPYTLGTYARLLRSNKRLAEAATAASQSLAMVERGGRDPDWRTWWVGEMHELLGFIAREDRRFDDSRKHFQTSLARHEQLWGEAGPRTIESRISLGRTEQAAGNLEAALAQYRRAAELQVKNRASLEGARPIGVLPYLDALSQTATAKPAERPKLAAEMLWAMQIPRGSETAKALRAMSTRIAAGDAKLVGVTRALQDADRRATAARHALAAELTKPAPEREAKEDDLKRQVREAEEKIEQLESQLQSEFPRYARLASERPLSVADIQALLRPDEGLLAFVSGPNTTFVVLARKDAVHMYRSRIGREGLEAEVRALRASLDLGADAQRAFDAARARQLYVTLFGPLAPRIADVRHLLSVPSGALLSLPLGVLLTKDPVSPTDYKTMPFLAADVGISVLPSVAALRDLRAVAGRSSAGEPFLAFADPAFGGPQKDRRSVSDLANACRQGRGVDPALLRTLPRLPESADEVKRIAAALGAKPDSVVLGAEATEARLRRTDVSRYRVVAFATHGLLPGELQCQAEPALALTPPASPSATEDGLLDASEVATLKLDADWVVLSACNTAGPDGSLGGESLSGLTRAFFYAGARALLASQWAVASDPTVELTTGAFAALAKDPGAGKAEALRRAQAALRAKPATAHPFFWAPFVLVGDGGAAR